MNDTTPAKSTRGSSEDFVTIASFPEPASANVAQAALESEGIESYMQGGTANSLIPVAFMARLQVSRSDEAAARAILQAAELTPESLEDVTAAEIADESHRG